MASASLLGAVTIALAVSMVLAVTATQTFGQTPGAYMPGMDPTRDSTPRNMRHLEDRLKQESRERFSSPSRGGEVSQSLEKNVSDYWIRSRVQSSLRDSRPLSGSDISVDSVQGTVRLQGRVSSEQDKARARQAAETVQGVRKVDADGLRVAEP